MTWLFHSWLWLELHEIDQELAGIIRGHRCFDSRMQHLHSELLKVQAHIELFQSWTSQQKRSLSCNHSSINDPDLALNGHGDSSNSLRHFFLSIAKSESILLWALSGRRRPCLLRR